MLKNPWPDFDVADAPRSPKSIVEELGAGLENKTMGVVKFYRAGVRISDENAASVTFNLYTPALRYHYPFLTITFPVDTSYPVKVVADKVPDAVANNENDLIASLTEIFNAPSTVQTIQRLMGLAEG